MLACPFQPRLGSKSHMPRNEWKGKWYDDDRETWNKYPEVMKACDHKVGVKDNGVFWMLGSAFGRFPLW